MVRRVLFLSAALLCGSVSIAHSTPATLVAGCTAGSCDAVVIAEIAALGRLTPLKGMRESTFCSLPSHRFSQQAQL